MLEKRREIKNCTTLLKSRVTSFLVKYRKRCNAFPISTINKLVKHDSYKHLSKLIINEVPIDTNIAVKDMQKRYNGVKKKISPAYFNPIIRGFISDSKKASNVSSIKDIYKSYCSQLDAEFKNLNLDLEYCLETLKALNKSLKDYNTKNKKAISESTDIYTESNVDISAEYIKIRADCTKNTLAFKKALSDKDYIKARMYAIKINDACEDFYKKLCDMDMSAFEAASGTISKIALDIGKNIAITYGAMEVTIKTIEVLHNRTLSKSQKKKVKEQVSPILFGNNYSKQVGTSVIQNSVQMLINVYNKLKNSKNIETKDLNNLYNSIKHQMKVMCAKSKLLINDVDRAQKIYGSEEKRKELEQDVKDAKNIFKESTNESEDYVMDKVLLEIMLDSFDCGDDDYYYETFSNPIRKYLKKIEKIKDEKPGESSTPEEVKKFVDDSYDDVIAASKILEKEPDKLTKADIIDLCNILLAYIGICGGTVIAIESSVVLGIITAAVGVIAMFLMPIITWIRRNNDVTVVKNLTKIKTSLEKLKDNKKLPADVKKRIEKMIEKISDAETDIYAKIKNVKESKEADSAILAVYKECAEGKITLEQRESLINAIKTQKETESIVAESSFYTDLTKKEKFNEVKRIAYERCANGEFSESTRDDIIKEAYNKIFVEFDASAAATPKTDDPEAKKDLKDVQNKIEKEMNDRINE
ncbi:hypothetical protein IKN40_04170 [bacterium]|nr:hypothetical protein [bacterium]